MIQIKPFQKSHVEEAANIFIQNYKILQKEYKELPSKYEDRNIIIPMLEDIIISNPSAVAIENGRVIGYMTGFANIKEFKGSAMGVYIPEWGHSSLPIENREEIYYELYRSISNEWVSNKNYAHCITYYANDELLKDIFYQLSFGLLVIDGVMPLHKSEVSDMDGIVVREAIEKDISGIKELDQNINKHLNKAPIFLYNTCEEQSDEEVKNEFINDEVKTFVAEKQGEILSCIRGMIHKSPNARILQDQGTLGINFGYTKPNIRGFGLAAKVLAELINWGIDNDMKRCAVDFESQNREGARFWLKHFKPICYSAIRKVDDRV